MKINIYSDGASRGNPGPSAAAFLILNEDGKTLRRYSEYLGVRTNNQAEYEGLISALESASELTSEEVVCYLDSELVVKHLNGEYQVRNPELRTLWLKVQDLKRKFKRISFIHVPRTNSCIEQVDWLANQVLDKAGGNIGKPI